MTFLLDEISGVLSWADPLLIKYCYPVAAVCAWERE